LKIDRIWFPVVGEFPEQIGKDWSAKIVDERGLP
jgi:hypothetical protein